MSTTSTTALQGDQKTAREAIGAALSAVTGTEVVATALQFPGTGVTVTFQALDEDYYDEIALLPLGLQPALPSSLKDALPPGGLLGSLNAELGKSFPTVAVLKATVSDPTMDNGCVITPVTNGVNCSGVGLALTSSCYPSCVAGYRPSSANLTCAGSQTLQFICLPVVTDQVVTMRVCERGLDKALPVLTAAVAAYLGVEALDVRGDANLTNMSILAEQVETIEPYAGL